jgi:FAD:protein FMN transferase
MGTAFSIDIRDPGGWAAAVAAVVDGLHHADAVFSTYRPGSDISRLRRGELRVADADPEVATVLACCADLARATGGWFSALPGGRLDPTGLVKGWAVERASDLLRRYGSANHAVNGGGDVQVAGEAAPGRPWSVGISDPRAPGTLLARLAGRDVAVATSGTAERGEHILDPFTGRPATGLLSVSVVGRRLSEVDAYATAAFAMGDRALGWVEALTGYDALVVGADGSVQRTSGWPAGRDCWPGG